MYTNQCQYLSDLQVNQMKYEERWSMICRNDFLRSSKKCWKRNLRLPQWWGDEDSVCGSKTRRHVGESDIRNSNQILLFCCRVNSFHFPIIAKSSCKHWFRKCYFWSLCLYFCLLSRMRNIIRKSQMSFPWREKQTSNVRD